MNQEIKKQWVDALRSGKYKQTQSQLHDRQGGYCCLGVLCDLHAQATGGNWTEHGYYMDQDEIVPIPVADWAGLQPNERRVSWNPHKLAVHVIAPEKDGVSYNLTSLNDSGQTFAGIADVIEKHL